MKRCGSCKQMKPLAEFGPSRNRPDGLQPQCRICSKLAAAKAYQKRRDALLSGRLEYQKDNPEKLCTKCGLVKPREAFGLARSRGDGLQHRCRDCRSKICADSYARNREEKNALGRLRYEENPEKYREQRRRFYAANPERARAQKRQIRERYLLLHPGAEQASKKKWRINNVEKTRELTLRRLAKKREAFRAAVDRLAIFERDGWTCQLCYTPVDPKLNKRHPMMASLDHIVPLSCGGTHEPSNVQLAHLICNIKKGGMLPSSLRPEGSSL